MVPQHSAITLQFCSSALLARLNSYPTKLYCCLLSNYMQERWILEILASEAVAQFSISKPYFTYIALRNFWLSSIGLEKAISYTYPGSATLHCIRWSSSSSPPYSQVTKVASQAQAIGTTIEFCPSLSTYLCWPWQHCSRCMCKLQHDSYARNVPHCTGIVLIFSIQRSKLVQTFVVTPTWHVGPS